jgi:phenylacetate-CoA ligase
LKYKGTTLYPPAIYDVLDNTPYVENYVVEVDLDENGNDEVLVCVGIKGADKLEELTKELKDRFRAKIRVAPEIEICSVDEIRKINFPDLSRKPIKFIDKRNKY